MQALLAVRKSIAQRRKGMRGSEGSSGERMQEKDC